MENKEFFLKTINTMENLGKVISKNGYIVPQYILTYNSNEKDIKCEIVDKYFNTTVLITFNDKGKISLTFCQEVLPSWQTMIINYFLTEQSLIAPLFELCISFSPGLL